MKRRAKTGALLILIFAATIGEARKAAPLTGELILDMEKPIITATIGGVDLRLRVAPDQKRLVELNRAAADRLALPFEKGADAQVGREIVPAIITVAEVRIEGRRLMAQVASHERDCCRDVDGEIGITLLPYASIHLVRGALRNQPPTQVYAIEDSEERGPETRLRMGKEEIFAAFSLTRAQSVATYSAASILASAYGGKLQTGATGEIEAAFGIVRPTRLLQLKNAADIAGFRFSDLPVRVADFGGRYDFPIDNAEPGDIVVQHRMAPQAAWPLVLIGRDRLDDCTELRFDRIARTLALTCDVAQRP